MHQRYHLAHLISASVVALVLTPLMACVDVQAQIAFMSKRDGNFNPEIYVMDADGSNPQNLTNHPNDDEDPAWYNPILSVAPAGKTLMIWGRLKQVNR